MDYLYYDTPIDQFSTYYPGKDQLYSSSITGQLPQTVALIRIVAALVFSAFCAVLAMATQRSSVLAGSFAAFCFGIALATTTVDNQILKKDPLVEAIYEIVGGKEKYEKLPEFKGAGKASFHYTQLNTCGWEKYEPMSKATTVDGRKVLIVKCLSRGFKKAEKAEKAQAKMIFALIEKYGPDDGFSNKIGTVIEKVMMALLPASLFEAALSPLSAFKLNKELITSATYGFVGSAPSCSINICRTTSSISCEMANELRAQL